MSEENQQKLHIVHTSCKGCIFAKYEGKTQVDCGFGDYLNIYQERDCVIEAYDEQEEFYIVNGRRCLARRELNWGQQRPPASWEQDARRELSQKIDVIIPLVKRVDFKLLHSTLTSLATQLHQPHSVVIVNNQGETPISQIHQFLMANSMGLNWSLTNMIERDSEGGRVSLGRMIDHVVLKLKGHFYLAIQPNTWLRPTVLKTLSGAIVDQLCEAKVIEVGEDLFAIATGFHKSSLVGGNRPVESTYLLPEGLAPGHTPSLLTSVVDKAKFIAEAYNMPNLVAEWKDLESCCK